MSKQGATHKVADVMGICTDEFHWYAAYTLARHEKAAARQLETRAIEYFLPLYCVTRQWEHRHAAFELPLFPSYLFVHIKREDRIKVLTTPGVLQLVGTKGIPSQIGDLEIDGLRNLLHSRKACPTQYLGPGNRVRFVGGPFAGLEGTVIRGKGQLRVIVSVDMIMRSIAIDVDCRELELVLQSLHHDQRPAIRRTTPGLLCENYYYHTY